MVNQAVILAGGQGTRLRPFTDTNPKPMYPVEGKPFLEYLILQLKGFGICKILLLLGYLPEKIIEYFGDGAGWGVEISYDVTPAENETGARLLHAKHLIEDNFLLLYCDNYCPIQFDKALEQYRKTKPLLQITAYQNTDGYSKSNLKIDADGKVLLYDKTRTASGLEYVDIGYAIAAKAILDYIPGDNVNFEKMVYPLLQKIGKFYVFATGSRYYSIGSYERLLLTKTFFVPKKVVFLDRDGTLNKKAKKAQYIVEPGQFVWLDGARDAVALLKKKGYLLILVTNQPGIAQGTVTPENLRLIHEKMQDDLGENKLDNIYCCTHGWDDGCACRKPKAGMLYQAAKDLCLDLTSCVLIGDDERDITAGNAAGCKCFFVDEQNSLLDIAKGLE